MSRTRVRSEDPVVYPYGPPPTVEDEILQHAEKILRSRLSVPGEALARPQAVGALFKLKLAAHQREVFAAVFLDSRHRLLAYEELFFGTVNGAEVHPREVAKRALLLNASAVIVAHNHPSQNPEPSAADRAVTARLKQALALVDIRLLDHFIVAGIEPPTSLAAKGWL